jgi:Fur family ferric uptake transcriptional regulator
MSCYETYIQELRSTGHRLTPQRVLILEALFHHGEHMTVDEVYHYVQSHNTRVNLSTIYRSLNFLTAQGLVTELHPGTGNTLYAAVKEKPHAHAVCQRCGMVLHVDATLLQTAMAQVAASTGFQVMIGSVELPGLCQACAS